jgi:hypothetical protein
MSQEYSDITPEEQLAIAMLKKDNESELMKLRSDTRSIDPLSNFFLRPYPKIKHTFSFRENNEKKIIKLLC